MPRRLGPAPAVLAAITAVTCLAALAACSGGDDDPPSSSGTPTASPTATASPTGTSSADGSADPSTDASTDAGPTGPVAEGEAAVLTFPDDYRILARRGAITSAEDDRGKVYVGFGELRAVGPDQTLDEQAAQASRNAMTDPPPKILDPVVVDGVELYHVAGVGFAPAQRARRVRRTGRQLRDFSVRVEMDDDIPDAERQEIVDAGPRRARQSRTEPGGGQEPSSRRNAGVASSPAELASTCSTVPSTPRRRTRHSPPS